MEDGLYLADGRLNLDYRPDYGRIVLPYCKWYQDDFLGGVRGMSATEIGVYTILLNEMYARGEALSLPDARLARTCGLPVRHFRRILDMLIREGKILPLKAGLWNERVESTLAARRNEHVANRNAGYKSGEKRSKINATDERTFNGRSTGAEPSSEAQNIGGGGGSARAREHTHAREEDPPEKAPEAVLETPRELVLAAMGVAPTGEMTPGGRIIGTQIDTLELKRWMGLGLTIEEITSEVARITAEKPDGPPHSFRYFRGAMQRLAAAKSETLPPMEPANAIAGRSAQDHLANNSAGGRRVDSLYAGFARAADRE